MSQERADPDEECDAHQKRRREHRQILEHRTHLLQVAAIWSGPARGIAVGSRPRFCSRSRPATDQPRAIINGPGSPTSAA